MATSADYGWVDDWAQDMHGYCLTLARGLTPAEFLARMNAEVEATVRQGLDAMAEPAGELWARHGGSVLFIGATTVAVGGGWVLGAEIGSGYLGVTPEVIVPVSAGTRVVSHFANGEAVDRFYWIDDRDIRLDFKPLDPGWREGSTPDDLVDVMTQVGFDLREDGDNTDHPAASAFALAEYLTGVRMALKLLEDSTYLCGAVQVPRG